MSVKISTNALKVAKALGGIDEILNRATAETLRQSAQYGKREGARQIVQTRFAPQLRATNVWSLTKIEFTSNQFTDWWAQSRTIVFSARSLRALYFSPVDTVHSTRVGVRYGVSVRMGGKRVNTGGFHLYGSGSNLKRVDGGKGKWGYNDWIFIRSENGIRPYWFPSVADILRMGSGQQQLEKKIGEKMQGYMIRNFNRYSHQVWKEVQILKI